MRSKIVIKKIFPYNFRKKVTKTKKFALLCPVPCSSHPAGQAGQGEKKTFALMAVSASYS